MTLTRDSVPGWLYILQSFTPRSPWSQGAQTGGGFSESSHHLFERTFKQRCIGTDQDTTQLSVSSPGKTSWTEDPVHTRTAANLLPEAGGSGTASTNRGENLYGYSALLNLNTNTHFFHVYTGGVKYFIWSTELFRILLLSRTCVWRQMFHIFVWIYKYELLLFSMCECHYTTK